MGGWLRGFLATRRDWRGRLWCLAKRDTDPALSALPGVPQAVGSAVLDLVCESFDVPASQRHCLRAGDPLMWLYLGGLGCRLWDNLEFVRLFMGLEATVGRPLSPSEMKAVAGGTVGTLAILIWFAETDRGST